MRRILSTVLVLSAAAAGATAARVETIDARSIEGDVRSVTADAVTVSTPDGGTKAVPRRDVAEIVYHEPEDRLGPDLMGQADRTVLATFAGDAIAAADLRLADGKWTFENPVLGRVSVPISAARTIYLPRGGTTPRQVSKRCAELKAAGRSKDALVVAGQKGQWMVVEGVLEAVDDKTITFLWKGGDRKMKRSKVQAVHLAATAGKGAAAGGSILGRDGTVIAFTSIQAGAELATVDAPAIGRREVPLRAISAVRFRSDRVVHLDGLKPVSVSEHGFFDKTFSYRVARAISGGPITLGGRRYRTGLSLHSYCELTYRLDGAYTTFVAVVGIDDAVRPGGDATLTILADGKALGEPVRLTGKDEPRVVRGDLPGAKTLTIRVEFGADGLDVADHVDLAAARLIK